MRARSLKPGFFKNETLAQHRPLVRLLFEGLWCMADRDGRLEDRPDRIKVEVLPYDACRIDAMLDDLTTGLDPFIVRYVVGGRNYIQILNFARHQHPHLKELPSTIPAPDSPGARNRAELGAESGAKTSDSLFLDSPFPITESGTGAPHRAPHPISPPPTGKPSNGRFEVPSPPDVRAFCREKGIENVNAAKFCAFYESKGWKVGNAPMRNWKAAIWNWSLRDA